MKIKTTKEIITTFQIERNNTETGYEYLYFITMNNRKYYFNPCEDIEDEFKHKIKASTKVTYHPAATNEMLTFHRKVITDCCQILTNIKGK